jgi:hypothetical protein
LSNWNIKNIPEKVKNESFRETLTYLKTKIVDGKEERSFVKARTSEAGQIFYSMTKREMSVSESHRIEITKKIEEGIYEEFLKNKDSKRKEVKREILHIIFGDRIFVIENYDSFALVRTTSHTADEEVSIPDWFGGVTDITEDEKFFSYNLSNPEFSA